MNKSFASAGIISSFLLITSCKTVELPVNEMILNQRQGYLFIILHINDKKGLFLLDTGAGISLIDYNQANRYGFKIGTSDNHGTITGVGGTNAVFTISDIDVMYSEFTMNAFKFYASDFTKINDVFDRHSSVVTRPVNFLM